MSSKWQKAKFLLGFGNEEEFPVAGPMDESNDIRLVMPDSEMSQPDFGGQPDFGVTGSVRPISSTDMPETVSSESPRRSSFVRPIPGTVTKPSVVSPVSFDDAQEVGDCLRAKQAVIVNLQNSSRDVARRLVDFASGLCYGLDGRMERVANNVYLLTPSDVEVSPEDRQLMSEADYRGR